MVERLARKAGRHFGWTIHEREDAAQDTLVRLLEYVLPRFDLNRSDRLEPFLLHAFRNHLKTRARTIRNARRRQLSFLRRAHATFPARPSPLGDAAASAVLEQIVAAPERFFSDRDAQILRSLIQHQHRTQQQMARDLGFGSRAALRSRCGKLLARFVAVAGRQLANLP